jgi:hypothetical protein
MRLKADVKAEGSFCEKEGSVAGVQEEEARRRR